MSSSRRERRKQTRGKSVQQRDFAVSFDPGSGNPVEVGARLIDSSDEGLGVELEAPLVPDSVVMLSGTLVIGGCRTGFVGRARVRWCKMVREGYYRAGLRFDDLGAHPPPATAVATYSPESEHATRRNILAFLLDQRIREPDQPGLTVEELQGRLRCHREHLAFSLWYLRERHYIAPLDHDHLAITACGVDYLENPGQQSLAAGRRR